MIPTIPLGKSGPPVSALCLGTMYFGTKVDADTSFVLLDLYAEAGGRFLDTANKYASWVPGFQGGESESVLGRWMRERKNRHEIFLATKVGLSMPGVEKGLRAWQIESECEKSLRRLGTDVIDLYYAHADDQATPMEETLAAFDRLMRSGKVRGLGASNFSGWRLLKALNASRAHGWAEYLCVQMRYSYLRPNPWIPQEFALQRPALPEMLDLCEEEGVRLLAYSPLLGGAYVRADRPLHDSYAGAANQARLRTLREVAGQLGATPNQLALAWLMQSRPAAIPLVAASTEDQLRENLRAAQYRLDETTMSKLSAGNQGGQDPNS
jgi:aryl-alcohol dehydrogenase-like predicted oxidoreductase